MARKSAALTPRQWLRFFALCLLWASAWLVDEAWPNPLPLPARQTLHNLILAAFAAIALAFTSRSPKTSRPPRPYAKLAIAGICLLTLPALLIDIARTAVSSTTVTELFAILPIAVVVLTPHLTFGPTPAPDTAHLLVPAFIGLTGILLILPFALPDTPRRATFQALVFLAVLLAAIASIWMHHLLASFTTLQAIFVVCLVNAAFSLAWLLVSSLATSTPLWPADLPLQQTLPPELATTLLYDLPQIALLLLLMRDLAPTRLSARYLAVPLLTILEGLAILRTGLSVKWIAGATLLAVAVFRLTTAPDRTDEPRLILH
jgi:hypothetical protein